MDVHVDDQHNKQLLMKIIQKTWLLRDPNLMHCKRALNIPNLGNPGDTILYYKAGLRNSEPDSES